MLLHWIFSKPLLLIMPGQVKVRRLNCWHKVSAVYAVGTLVSLPCRLQIFRTLICDQTGDNYTLSWVLVMCPRPADQSEASILVTWSVWTNQGLSHWPQELENKLRMVQDSFIHWVGANHRCVFIIASLFSKNFHILSINKKKAENMSKS